MLRILMLFSLNCAEPQINNYSGKSFEDHDYASIEYVKGRCKELYKDHPCMIRYTKERHFKRIVCGKEIKKD